MRNYVDIRVQKIEARAQAHVNALNEAASPQLAPEFAPRAAGAPQIALLAGTVKINLPKEFSGARAVPEFLYEVKASMQMRQIESSIMTLMPQPY